MSEGGARAGAEGGAVVALIEEAMNGGPQLLAVGGGVNPPPVPAPHRFAEGSVWQRRVGEWPTVRRALRTPHTLRFAFRTMCALGKSGFQVWGEGVKSAP